MCEVPHNLPLVDRLAGQSPWQRARQQRQRPLWSLATGLPPTVHTYMEKAGAELGQTKHASVKTYSVLPGVCCQGAVSMTVHADLRHLCDHS